MSAHPFRYMNLLRDPPASSPKYENLSAFLQKLFVCLTYHHDHSQQHNLEVGQENATCSLYQHLKRDFFKKLYIERNERAELYDCCFANMVTLFSGARGSGKSTVLLKLDEELRGRPDLFVHYINLKMKRPEIKSLSSLHRAHKNTVCAVIFKDIYETYIRDNESLRPMYVLHKVRNHSRYQALAIAIAEGIQPKNNEEWLTALQEAKNAAIRQGLDIEMPPAAADEDLWVLMDFLSKHHGHAVLLLDDIDRYGMDLQREVVRKAVDVHGKCTPIIAVRTHNAKMLERAESDGAGGDVLNIVSTRKFQYKHLDMETGIIKNAILRRLDYVRNLTGSSALPPGVNSDLQRFEDLLRTVCTTEYASTMMGALDQWYNHSLRHISVGASEFIGRIIGDADPAYPMEKLRHQSGVTTELAIRRLRNATFKYLICGKRDKYDRHSPVINIYDSPYRVEMLPMPEFSLLVLLNNLQQREDKSLSYRELCEVFAPLGLDPDRTADILDSLRLTDDAGGFGFILVEKHDKQKYDKIADDALIELQPAGKFFVERLTHSCEYTFWMALDTKVTERYLALKAPKVTELTIEATGENDELRLYISAQFVYMVVLPTIMQAENLIRGNVQAGRSYWRIFPGKKGAHLPNLVSSMRGFVRSNTEYGIRAAGILDKIDSALK